jgi:hypothetical protein
VFILINLSSIANYYSNIFFVIYTSRIDYHRLVILNNLAGCSYIDNYVRATDIIKIIVVDEQDEMYVV